MNTIARRIHAAIEHHKVEKLFRQELKRTDLSRFHRKMTWMLSTHAPTS